MAAIDSPRKPFSMIREFHLADWFTLANAVCGIGALFSVMTYLQVQDVRHIHFACALVLAALVFDVLDGRIARWRHTSSPLGREHDSLADVITFGVAPALLACFWGLHEFGRIGWLVPLFFMVCCATRLARFNVQTRVVDSRYFVGLPTPAAAGAICSILFFAPDRAWRTWVEILMLVALIAVGLLMVSTFRYRSFKKFDLRKRWSYRALVPVAAVVLVTALAPRAFFLAVAVLYTLSGPVGWLWGRLHRSGEAPAAEPPDEASDWTTRETGPAPAPAGERPPVP